MNDQIIEAAGSMLAAVAVLPASERMDAWALALRVYLDDRIDLDATVERARGGQP